MTEKFRKIFGNLPARKPLFVSMLTMGAIGIIYIWSVFIIPLEAEFGWPRNRISLVFTVTMTCLSLGLSFGGFVHTRTSIKHLIVSSMLLLTVSFAVTSFTNSLGVMIFFYGALCGSVMGIVYNLIIYTCNLWFSKDVAATVSGMLQSCLAVSTIFLSYLAAGLLDAFDWRVTMRVLGLIFIVVLSLAYKYLRQPVGPVTIMAAAHGDEPVGGLNWREMLHTRSFWLFWTIRFFILSGCVGMSGHAVPVAIELGASHKNAIFALGLLSFFSGAGRTIFGIIWDTIGVKKTIFLGAASFITAFFLLLLIPLHKNQYLILLAFALCGFSYGGANVMGISFTRTVFGMKHFAENFGFTSTPMIVSSFLGPYIMGEMKLLTGSYYDCFTLFAAMGCSSLIFLFLIKKTSY